MEQHLYEISVERTVKIFGMDVHIGIVVRRDDEPKPFWMHRKLSCLMQEGRRGKTVFIVLVTQNGTFLL
jgi:hypothetical protein